MERFEEPAAECMGFAAARPRSTVQCLHSVEEVQCFLQSAGFGQPQRANPLVISHRAPELLARIGAEQRAQLATARCQAAQLESVRRDSGFIACEAKRLERLL